MQLGASERLELAGKEFVGPKFWQARRRGGGLAPRRAQAEATRPGPGDLRKDK